MRGNAALLRRPRLKPAGLSVPQPFASGRGPAQSGSSLSFLPFHPARFEAGSRAPTLITTPLKQTSPHPTRASSTMATGYASSHQANVGNGSSSLRSRAGGPVAGDASGAVTAADFDNSNGKVKRPHKRERNGEWDNEYRDETTAKVGTSSSRSAHLY